MGRTTKNKVMMRSMKHFLNIRVGLGVALLLSSVSGPAQTLNAPAPDQAHAMMDVGYHFGNLWFAADKQNWPLAGYYLGETRLHLKWAVQIQPTRLTKSGAKVDLNGILAAVDNTLLAELDKAIENKDVPGFKTAYRRTI